jgi:prolyl 4-hydroxylase
MMPMIAEPVARLTGAPGVQKVPHREIDMFIVKRFLSAEECHGLCALIDADRRPSTIADSNGDPGYRTSETCDLRGDVALVAAVNARIDALLGLDGRFGEPLQGQHYDVSQTFKAHTDYFEPGGRDYDRHCSRSGQRTWTAMAYLNAPRAGGNTVFGHVGKTVQPEVGKLVVWSSLNRWGVVNPWTMHEARPIRAGEKYVITKWYRERPWA